MKSARARQLLLVRVWASVWWKRVEDPVEQILAKSPSLSAQPADSVPPGATRLDLPRFLLARGLVGVGAEIGVQDGDFSDWLLLAWPGACLISIDPWRADVDDAYRDVANVGQEVHDRAFETTIARLSKYGQRSVVWRMTSAQAAPLIAPGALDFVYLDARHDYASVSEDLNLWFDKVRAGGVVAGHDYLDGEVVSGVFGVRSAVDDFFASRGLLVHTTSGDAPFSTWIVFKPESGRDAGIRPTAGEIVAPVLESGSALKRAARRARSRIFRSYEWENELRDEELAQLGREAVRLRVDSGRTVQALLERIDALETQFDSLLAPSIANFGLLPGQRQRIYKAADGGRRAICSLATGSFVELLGVAAATFEPYARYWGWDLVLSTEDLADGRPAPWGKIPFIRDLLSEYDWVLWLDADTVIVDLARDVFEMVEPDKDVYLVEHVLNFSGDARAANTGVMLLRAGEWTNELLRRTWENDAFVHHGWWENAALLDVLGYEIGAESTSKLTTPGPLMERVKLIDPAWNSIWAFDLPHPVITHHAALPFPSRRRAMLDDYRAFRQSLTRL
jgi:hypothetical protein